MPTTQEMINTLQNGSVVELLKQAKNEGWTQAEIQFALRAKELIIMEKRKNNGK